MEVGALHGISIHPVDVTTDTLTLNQCEYCSSLLYPRQVMIQQYHMFSPSELLQAILLGDAFFGGPRSIEEDISFCYASTHELIARDRPVWLDTLITIFKMAVKLKSLKDQSLDYEEKGGGIFELTHTMQIMECGSKLHDLVDAAFGSDDDE